MNLRRAHLSIREAWYYTLYTEVLTFVDWLTALRFAAAGAPPSGKRIWILPMNQYAWWTINVMDSLTALCFTGSSAIHAWGFVYDFQQWTAVISPISRSLNFNQWAVWRVMVRDTSEQRVILYDTYMKCASARECRGKFRRKFHDARVPSRQTLHNLANKLRTTGQTRNMNMSAECLLRRS
jgi:hypothetical protein